MPGRWEDPLMLNFGLPSRESRIAVALAFAVLFSCVGAFLYSDDLFQSFTSAARWNQVRSSGFESSESLNMSNLELALLSERYTELEKQFKELSLKLQLLEQGTDPAQEHLKAGPFSTIKANRTNPTLTPDETVNPRLAKLLNEIALNNEVIVALATTKVKEILKIWFENIKRVGIRNYLVVALDDDIESFCRSNQVPVYRTDPDESKDSIARNGGGAAISGLKFRILRDFLQLGYSLLVSDTDIIYLQNPFDHLYRDCDVESMSDGFDNMTTYGYQETFDDPMMVWSRFAHTMRIMVFNAGFFYIRSMIPSIELLDRVAGRLSREPNLWDQDLFNEELFFPSHPGYDGLYASKRAMDMYLFMNSKVLFKIVWKDSELRKIRPVIVHVNYHPDKLPRLKATVEFYVNGNQNALDPLPDGSQQ